MPYVLPQASSQSPASIWILFFTWLLILALNAGLLYAWFRWIQWRRKTLPPKPRQQNDGEIAVSKISLSVEIADGTRLQVLVEDVGQAEGDDLAEPGGAPSLVVSSPEELPPSITVETIAPARLPPPSGSEQPVAFLPEPRAEEISSPAAAPEPAIPERTETPPTLTIPLAEAEVSPASETPSEPAIEPELPPPPAPILTPVVEQAGESPALEAESPAEFTPSPVSETAPAVEPPAHPSAVEVPVEASIPHSIRDLPPDFSSIQWRQVLWDGRWLLLAASIIIFLLAYVAIFAPHTIETLGKVPLPNNFGRPYYGLHFLRDMLSRNYDKIGLLIGGVGGLATLAAFLGFAFRKSRRAGEFCLLSAGITLAGLGQWALNFQPPRMTQGAMLYGAAILLFGVWAYLARQRLPDNLLPTGKTRWDLIIVIGILAVTAYTRLYAYPTYPYGVEGDEKNWTSEVVRVMVERRGDFSGEYHINGVPVTFFMQAPFYALFGAGINAARLAVIFYSILGSLMFFLVLRQIGPLPVAALGAGLLGISIADISASRLANVESHVKFWPLLALALLAWAIKKNRWEPYLIAGIALALAVLTFDTVAPMAVVLFLAALVELLRQRKPFGQVVLRLTALAGPSLLAVPMLVAYFEGRFTDYGVGQRWSIGLLEALRSHLGQVLQSWFVQTYSDFIYNRANGPMTNAALLPWLVFGIIVALATLRKPVSIWVILWAGLTIIPVPTLTERPVARVYYVGLPAMYALIALGMFIFLKEVDHLLGKNWRVVWILIAAVALTWVGLFNQFIYFNEVYDPQARQVIRELGEYVHAGADENTHFFITYLPGANSQIYAEDRTIELYLHGKVPNDQIRTAYEMIPFADFLPRLTTALQSWQKVEVIFDEFTNEQADQRNAVEQALERCFPNVISYRGLNLARYSLPKSVLENPACMPVSVSLTAPEMAYWVNTNLSWALNTGTATSVEADCDRARPDVVWAEVEDFLNQGGWQEDTQNARDWMGRGFMFDYPDNRELMYGGTLPEGDKVYAWVRTFKRRVDASPGIVRIGSQSFPFANFSEDELGSWQWERIGPFDLTVAHGAAYISRPFPENNDDFVAIFVDAVVFTADPAFSPFEGTLGWLPAVEQTQEMTQPANNGTVALILPGAGRYRCRLSAASSDITLVDAYGNAPVWSNFVEFEVKTGP